MGGERGQKELERALEMTKNRPRTESEQLDPAWIQNLREQQSQQILAMLEREQQAEHMRTQMLLRCESSKPADIKLMESQFEKARSLARYKIWCVRQDNDKVMELREAEIERKNARELHHERRSEAMVFLTHAAKRARAMTELRYMIAK